jgi:NADP-dependent 3-hydroxy acid dehydrogenase YdfG
VAERLDGTVALVTGASSGIGEATARSLAGLGASVALVARRRDRLESLAAELDRALVIEADVSDGEQAIAAVETAVRELGRLDTVINNAGVMLLGPVQDAPLEEWERMIDTNLKGALYVAHAALPHLLRAAESEPRHVADLVNVSSVAGRVARLGNAVYAATKWGVNAFTEALRSPSATCASRRSSRAQRRPSSAATCARKCVSRRWARCKASSGWRRRTSPRRSPSSSRGRAA